MEQKNKSQAKPLKEKVDAQEAKEAFEKTQKQFAPPPGMVKDKATKGGGDVQPAVAKESLTNTSKQAPELTADSPYLAEHTVVAGDNLSLISQKYYGTQNHFMKIYQANKEVIGNDPNRIRPGQVLKIPKM